MATEAEKNLVDFVETAVLRLMLISRVDFTEEIKKRFLPKFEYDENFKNKIEESHRVTIKVLEECSKLETISEEARHKIRELIDEATIEEYTNKVYEFLCRIAILEEVKDDVTSLEQFYEESIYMAQSEYLTESVTRVNSPK